jgi:predicted enzyme related to lactoylglutathione lyase
MTRKRDISAGAPCWIDMASSDPAVTRSFYTGVFGWTADEPNEEFGGYFMFNVPGSGPVAGCMPALPESSSDIWVIYLSVEDAAKTLDAVAAHGGKVVESAMQVGDVGTMGIAIDPGGAVIGIWQPNQFPGIVDVGAPGLPSWFELHANNFDAQLAFYRDVFGWTTELAPTPFKYAMLTRGGNQLAGIMEGGDDGRWSAYIWTTDVDETIAAALRLGGRVVRAAEDTPYGRLATIADPNGATIKLMAANDQMPAN